MKGPQDAVAPVDGWRMAICDVQPESATTSAHNKIDSRIGCLPAARAHAVICARAMLGEPMAGQGMAQRPAECLRKNSQGQTPKEPQ